MDKVKIIEGKIHAFFQANVSLKNRIFAEMLSLKVNVSPSDKVSVLLFKNNDLLKEVKLGEVLQLTTLERFVTSDEKIEKGLVDAFKKKAQDKNVSIQLLVLEILPNKKYYIHTGSEKEEITINEIL